MKHRANQWDMNSEGAQFVKWRSKKNRPNASLSPYSPHTGEKSHQTSEILETLLEAIEQLFIITSIKETEKTYISQGGDSSQDMTCI